jgi:enoyl-[acyl-carrier-protein] reductase (NADH)
VLVTGIADEQSIAWGCARAFHDMGARLAVTYRNERDRAAVQPLADSLQALCLPLDVTVDGQMQQTSSHSLETAVNSGCCIRRCIQHRLCAQGLTCTGRSAAARAPGS